MADTATQATPQKRQYKNEMALRVSKAAASTRCRRRKQWLVDNPTMTEADLPEDLHKVENFQKGRRTTDTSDMSDAEIEQLEKTRVAKAIASRQCNARKRWRKTWMEANGGAEPTEADMPEELRIVRKAKNADEPVDTSTVVEVAAETLVEKPAKKKRGVKAAE